MSLNARVDDSSMSRTHERKRGADSTQTSVRFPDDLLARIGKDGGAHGDSFRSAVVRLLDASLDAIGELGEQWTTEVQLRAYAEQITEGQALGRFAREAIEAAKTKR
jgi:hypothetical protein